MPSAGAQDGSGMPEPASLPPVRERSLPLGVAVLSILVGLYGFLLFVVGLLLFVPSVDLGRYHVGLPATLSLTPHEFAALVTVLGLILIGIGVALWRLRLWALVLGLLFLIYLMVSYALVHDFESLGFVLSLVIFLYLVAVNRHFR